MNEQAVADVSLQRAVSVVLLGGNDPAYRARAAAYYAEQACEWPLLEAAPDQPWSVSLQCALEQVDTPYVLLAKDTDFILPDALEAAVAWLQAHPSEQSALGYVLGYRPGNSVVDYHKVGDAYQGDSTDGPLQRIRRFAECGQQAWRAVVRVEALRAVLGSVPAELSGEGWLVGLSCALLLHGSVKVLEHTAVVSECPAQVMGSVAREETLAHVTQALVQWDHEQKSLWCDDQGFVILREFIHATYGGDELPLLFTSAWGSVVGDPERRFEPQQFVELPYYNAPLFRRLSGLEFFIHAWPVGQTHINAVEGTWVRQRDLLHVHPNDTDKSLQERYWQALVLSLFDPVVCRRLADSLVGEDMGDQVSELNDWLARLDRVKGIDLGQQLTATPSGRVLQALADATPDAAGRKRIMLHLAKRKEPQLAFIVLDLEDDNAGLQRTFDSILASGVRDFRLVVLKVGALPAITTARDTLHFIKVTAANVVSHLNQVVRQLSSEWMLLLQAGDELTAGGLLRLRVELVEAPGCQAICGNEVQRDTAGRLVGILRPGADFDLLRSRPDLMSRHWLMRRETVVALGGYSETYRHALEFDLLLRLVEAQGLGGLAHLDEYLVIGRMAGEAMMTDALATLNRHMTQLGYQGAISEGAGQRLHLDFRHTATPLVSILLVADADIEQLKASLASIVQRTRYPRYEVLVVSEAHASEYLIAQLGSVSGIGKRVRLVTSEQPASYEALINLAVTQAQGDYLVLFGTHCQVMTPAWIGSLLNQAQRPEVGIVGCQMYDLAGAISHAGYELLDNQSIHASWLGLPVDAFGRALGLDVVRGAQAVSGNALMVRRDVFEHCGGLSTNLGADIDLCQQVAQAGLLILMAPDAKVLCPVVPVVSDQAREYLVARWPAAFNRRVAADAPEGVEQSRSAMPGQAIQLEWLRELS
ncbi:MULTISPECIES: glycosyltransferase family 2 protein [Pseudomonas]|uniref:glycosyltransferase family 2 protein n=1 Tax=Pseudomonas TaxID=286 RepID=UPI0008635B4E|nr:MULTISPECIES: glycosyltransferase [Pseudomonas]MCL8305624.1 glycosyltransferase [Pseudomonas putida]